MRASVGQRWAPPSIAAAARGHGRCGEPQGGRGGGGAWVDAALATAAAPTTPTVCGCGRFAGARGGRVPRRLGKRPAAGSRPSTARCGDATPSEQKGVPAGRPSAKGGRRGPCKSSGCGCQRWGATPPSPLSPSILCHCLGRSYRRPAWDAQRPSPRVCPRAGAPPASRRARDTISFPPPLRFCASGRGARRLSP